MTEQVSAAKSTTESRLRIVLQASMTTAIIAGAAYIREDYALVREVIRAFAPFISLVCGVIIDFFVRRHNYHYEEARCIKHSTEYRLAYNSATDPDEKERAKKNWDFWENQLQAHRANNNAKIEV